MTSRSTERPAIDQYDTASQTHILSAIIVFVFIRIKLGILLFKGQTHGGNGLIHI